MKTYYVAGLPYSDELWHYGVKGQKWGIRRFQNPDGTYTQEGLKRYRKVDAKADLGYKRFQRINDIQNNYVGRYKKDVKGYMNNTKRELKSKNEIRRAKYEKEAKAYLARSENTKLMNQYYNSLFKSDQRSLNRLYKDHLVTIGRDAAHSYIDRELLRMKVSADRQKEIWNN